MNKKIQYGADSFKEIEDSSALYIDKTAKIYNLITKGSRRFFLSRPRRFGKTLLVDTLSEIFQGNKELFKGLAIYNTDYDWKPYPVIRLSFHDCNARTSFDLDEYLKFKVQLLPSYIQNNLSSFNPKDSVQTFSLLFNSFNLQKQQVVILIDEYDYPVINNIHLDTKTLDSLREILKSFYSVLKDNSGCIKFLFLTGVTRITKTSIFSGLNNLNDISSSEDFADILGYTQEELETYFDPYINEGAKKLNISRSSFLKKIKLWYDGYRFSKKELKVYNPSSINKFFESGTFDFDTYWISTGTPEFLVKLLSKKEHTNFDIQEEFLKERSDFLSSNELDVLNPDLISLIYQAGYITVTNYNSKNGRFKLDFPNNEVRKSFLYYLAEAFLNTSEQDLKSYHGIEDALLDKDPSKFIKEVKKFFHTVPFSSQPTREFTFQVALLALLYNSKQLKVDSEVTSSRGRSDIVVISDDTIFVIELKVDVSPDVAIKQIEEKKYTTKYTDDHRFDSYSVLAIAIEFDSSTKELKDSCIKTIR